MNSQPSGSLQKALLSSQKDEGAFSYSHIFSKDIYCMTGISKDSAVSVPTAFHTHQPLYSTKQALTHTYLALSVDVSYKAASSAEVWRQCPFQPFEVKLRQAFS